MADASVTLFLAGDVMTGRGIDQVLPSPSDPELFESYVRDARDYVDLAVRANGPIPRPVDFTYLWATRRGVRRLTDARIVNSDRA
jgi:poly-gamma-glutamate synthesis protein (capsule biosynthesis protein)